MDNYAFIELIIVFGGWRRREKEAEGALLWYLIMRLIRNYQILKKARQNLQLPMPLESLKTGLEQVFIAVLHLAPRNHANRSVVCIQLPIKPQTIQ